MKIGIALATYNPNTDFFRQQIESLRGQTLTNWVCIISDESSDLAKSKEIKDLLREDQRFQFIRNQRPGQGVVYNFENALTHIPSDCDYVACCDQDDIWVPHKLEMLVSILQAQPKKSLVHSDLELIDEKNQTIHSSCWQAEKRDFSSPRSLLNMVYRNRVTGCAALFSRDLHEVALPFPPGLRGEYLHDQWLGCLALIFGQLVELPEKLVRYRQHGQNVIGAQTRAGGNYLQKLKMIFQKSEKALQIRQKLAIDLIQRAKLVDPTLETSLEQELAPLLRPSPFYFFKKLMQAHFQFPYFYLWLQLFIGALMNNFISSKEDSR